MDNAKAGLKIYKVQLGETLAEIAARVGMSAAQLQDFHNTHCHEAGLLGFANFLGITCVVTPREYKSPQKITEEMEINFPAAELSPTFYLRQYRVMERWETRDGKKQELSFDLLIRCFRREDQIVAIVGTDNFKKNRNVLSSKMAAISKACFDSISPVSYNPSPQGRTDWAEQSDRISTKVQGETVGNRGGL